MTNVVAYKAKKQAEEYANQLGIDVFLGLEDRPDLTPVVMPMDDKGRPLILNESQEGVGYYFSRIDYYDRDSRVIASRRIYLIMPGQHSQPTYLPSEGHTKVFEVHSGFGCLMVGDPNTEDNDSFSSAIYELDPKVTPLVTVPANKFYVFEAMDFRHDPLIVSELVKYTNGKGPKEITIKANQETVVTDNRRVNVPEEFSSCSFN
jgi:hypothetical protein